jgi:lysozyme
MIKGIDISHWQGTIEWPAIPKEYEFVFMKASETTNFVDPMFHENWEASKDEGFCRGAYHFWRYAGDPVQQAQCFAAVVGEDLGELPPVLDVEDPNAPKGVDTPERILLCADEIERLWGQKPIIYTACWYWNEWVRTAADNDLWTAHWKPVWMGSPCLPIGWNDWKFWQYSSRGSVPGIQGNVDLDVFYGDKEEWQKYIGEVPIQKVVKVIAPPGVKIDVSYEG